MIWNYRVFREEDDSLSIREVFYEQDGAILACGEPVQVTADSIHELTELLDGLREALTLSILILDEVPKRTEPYAHPQSARPTLSHEAVLAELEIKPKSEKHEDV